MTMVPVVKLNYVAAPDGYAELARNAMDVDTSGMDRFQAAEIAVEKIEYLQNKYPYREIYLAEAGWPSGPKTIDPDRYSEPVQKEFYKDLLPMLDEKGIKSYLFEAFDEKWKESPEPGVGPNWGIFREDRTPKPRRGYS